MQMRMASLSFIILFMGCTGGLLEEMNRTHKNPFDGALEIVCFEKEGEVGLSWEEDPGADEYLILRAQDSRAAEEPAWSIVYRGGRLSWTDRELTNDERRIYTLMKRRGSRFFKSSTAVLGVGNDVVRDVHEPNNSRDWAKVLTHIIEANIQRYRSYNYLKYGKSLEYFDTDWYYVRIPAGRGASITLTQRDITPDGHIILEVLSERAGEVLKEVESGKPFVLENQENVERVFRFRIRIDPARIFATAAGVGGKTVSYVLRLNSIFILPKS